MFTSPLLVSHHLCPYVQRAAIVAAERGIELERTFVDLAAKPDWFLALSPTGKVPLLQVTDGRGEVHILFESAVIAEYLDETGEGVRLLPEDPIHRARTRAWVEFASATLSDIAGLYAAIDEATLEAKRRLLERRFCQLEGAFVGPWFTGERFGLADAAFAPVFRYLDAFEALADISIAEGLLKVAGWRSSSASRPSAACAVSPDYPERLREFLLGRSSHLSRIIAERQVLSQCGY